MVFQDQVNGFTCSCAVGWTGDTCGDDIDDCAEVSECSDGSNCTVSFFALLSYWLRVDSPK